MNANLIRRAVVIAQCALLNGRASKRLLKQGLLNRLPEFLEKIDQKTVIVSVKPLASGHR